MIKEREITENSHPKRRVPPPHNGQNATQGTGLEASVDLLDDGLARPLVRDHDVTPLLHLRAITMTTTMMHTIVRMAWMNYPLFEHSAPLLLRRCYERGGEEVKECDVLNAAAIRPLAQSMAQWMTPWMTNG